MSKEYRVSVPVNCVNLDDFGRENILKKLKELDATRVFLNFEEAVDTGFIYCADEHLHQTQMQWLKDAAAFFKSRGYEVAVWAWALMVDPTLPFDRLVDFAGNTLHSFGCRSEEHTSELQSR